MRICYVADGASIHTQRWVNYLAQKGHEVHLICWKAISGYEANVHFHWLTRLAPGIWPVSRYLSFLFWILQVRKLVGEIEPDVVDGHFSTIYGFLAACAGFHPLVVTAWGSDIMVQAKQNPFLAILCKYGLKRAELIVCRSPALKSEISKLGISESKIRIIIMGVNTTEFQPEPDNTALAQGPGKDSTPPTVISTRSLSPVYNVETLIRAIPLVLKQFPAVKFVIVGGGEDRDYLQGLAQSLLISDAVQFIGQVPHNEISRYLSSSDIYVSTSLSDGTSNSLLEAMACGLAPVVTDIPANRAWVKDGENGFLFPVKDAQALAAIIIDVVRDEEKRKSFGSRSRDIVLGKAAQTAEMHKLEVAYQELVIEKE